LILRCGKCSPPCEEGTEYQLRDCSNGTDRICLACQKCSGNRFEISRCAGMKDTECATCDNGNCTDGTYESRGCKTADESTGLMLHECKTCSFPGGCNPYDADNPTFEKVPCSGNSIFTDGTDRVCLPCTKECQPGYEMLEPCTFRKDSICVNSSQIGSNSLDRSLAVQAACSWDQCIRSSSSQYVSGKTSFYCSAHTHTHTCM
jgi:hypothetical protein